MSITKKSSVICFCFIIFLWDALIAQTTTDSLVQLKEIQIVTIYPTKTPVLRSPASVSILKSKQLEEQPDGTLVPALNTIPGVRMEERSPGSYRLSIRGSLLRSPFGIKNVKIYMDEFPLTDAGGNTYLNLLEPSSIKNIEIIKGPEGSLFGANTGGVVLFNIADQKPDSSIISYGVTIGSYNLLNEHAAFDKQWKRYRLNLSAAFQTSDGYRENSDMKRGYVHTFQQWDYKQDNNLKLLILYSNLQYKTPGALTLNQFEKDPQMARPSTATLPGSTEQKAGIYNQTFYGGISNELKLLPDLTHIVTLFASHTDFKNPFITNYEIRNENTIGTRTYIELNKHNHSFIKWKWNIGLEAEQTQSAISNYGNDGGTKTNLQTADDIAVQQAFGFTQLSLDLNQRWIIEGAISINNYAYSYKNNFPYKESSFTKRKLDIQLMPRAAVSYKIFKNLAWRISGSKGYSPPTVSEIRPSDNIIYNNLQAESGWNYETGIRYITERLEADLTLFDFKLENTIVRRVNEDGAEYFVNAGHTDQKGIELQGRFELIKPNTQFFIRELVLRNSFSYYYFLFKDYHINSENYSGMSMTGVPKYTNVVSASINFPKDFYLFIQYNHTSPLPLNDANTAYAAAYDLLQIKAGWKYTPDFDIYIGIDNALNSSYSLGNDINAAGGRYYNAAPKRNYFVGIKARF